MSKSTCGPTPGPWKAELGVQNTYFIRANGGDEVRETICLVDTEKSEIEQRGAEMIIRRVGLPHGEANASLIAAAPDMLAALKAVMSEWREGYGLNCVAQVRTAIAHAEGRGGH